MTNKYLEKIAASQPFIKPSHVGLLHKKMGIKEGQPISSARLAAEKAEAKRTHNVKLEREVLFAQNMRKAKSEK